MTVEPFFLFSTSSSSSSFVAMFAYSWRVLEYENSYYSAIWQWSQQINWLRRIFLGQLSSSSGGARTSAQPSLPVVCLYRRLCWQSLHRVTLNVQRTEILSSISFKKLFISLPHWRCSGERKNGSRQMLGFAAKYGIESISIGTKENLWTLCCLHAEYRSVTGCLHVGLRVGDEIEKSVSFGLHININSMSFIYWAILRCWQVNSVQLSDDKGVAIEGAGSLLKCLPENASFTLCVVWEFRVPRGASLVCEVVLQMRSFRRVVVLH